MNTKLTVSIAVIVALVLVVGALFYFTRPAAAPSTGSTASTTEPGTQQPTPGGASSTPGGTPTSTANPGPKSYTMAQVASHNTTASCWTAIRGKVYDLTSWISQHPGGREAIIEICGKDGTAAFVGQHGGSPQQESILATFQIGALAQ